MRCVVVSDSHRNPGALEKLFRLQPGADLYIHCGDGCGDAELFRAAHPDVPFLAVAGNSDSGNQNPVRRIIELEGFCVFITHGHEQRVKHGLAPLIAAANRHRANIVLFGHTHIPCCKKDGDLWLLNPGALMHHPALQFATLDIIDHRLIPNLCAVRYNHFPEDL